MKSNYFKVSILLLAAVFTISCSKDDSTGKTETTTTSSVTTTNTLAKISVLTSSGVPKPNYILMVFDQQFSTTAPLPPILKQVTTDANGLASFDLSTIVTNTTPKSYYFEAFVQNGNDFVLKSIVRTEIKLAKGSSLTTAVIVN
ncbi:hypothetical protein JE952_000647 [Flavobacterium psychrophilum]|uniref:hypothetical protein n=1 Tax=Flavobacterium psychrophilum TaxID=96345 RepID=UPI000B7C26F9|nr:hypothetical protein [Flavobacterium psychrophilum]EKT4549041.1 hypothetical protein [Flavobacterium psychrophilum]ELI6454760.1 hypothetical protein [Flavobacterium psychrophilum]MBF2093064.1 hypothetical protein [Flavobacterium psychrophilum]MCB6099472.1 hypothetical protein [Flavobacterium psychrophilum]SNA65058.1 conserved exported hypothetical protein [Flavobacterium psychrophilum]